MLFTNHASQSTSLIISPQNSQLQSTHKCISGIWWWKTTSHSILSWTFGNVSFSPKMVWQVCNPQTQTCCAAHRNNWCPNSDALFSLSYSFMDAMFSTGNFGDTISALFSVNVQRISKISSAYLCFSCMYNMLNQTPNPRATFSKNLKGHGCSLLFSCWSSPLVASICSVWSSAWLRLHFCVKTVDVHMAALWNLVTISLALFTWISICLENFISQSALTPKSFFSLIVMQHYPVVTSLHLIQCVYFLFLLRRLCRTLHLSTSKRSC